MGCGKKLIQYENSFSDKLHQQESSAVQWGYSDARSLCEKPKQALIALTCCVGYIDCSCAGTCDLTALMSRMSLSLTLWVSTV